MGTLSGHENRVSCLGVSNDGISLCTGSWDSTVSTIHSKFPKVDADNLIAQDLGLVVNFSKNRTSLDSHPKFDTLHGRRSRTTSIHQQNGSHPSTPPRPFALFNPEH